MTGAEAVRLQPPCFQPSWMLRYQPAMKLPLEAPVSRGDQALILGLLTHPACRHKAATAAAEWSSGCAGPEHQRLHLLQQPIKAPHRCGGLNVLIALQPHQLGKPRRRALRKGWRSGFLPTSAMVAARLFTDVAAGNRLGLFKTVLGEAVDPRGHLPARHLQRAELRLAPLDQGSPPGPIACAGVSGGNEPAAGDSPSAQHDAVIAAPGSASASNSAKGDANHAGNAVGPSGWAARLGCWPRGLARCGSTGPPQPLGSGPLWGATRLLSHAKTGALVAPGAADPR